MQEKEINKAKLLTRTRIEFYKVPHLAETRGLLDILLFAIRDKTLASVEEVLQVFERMFADT